MTGRTNIFTLSAYETSAEDFFGALRAQKCDLVLDVRLKNTSQLCGFTKKKDLTYLVPQITGACYIHDEGFAPTDDLLDRYLKKHIDWDAYSAEYLKLIEARGGRQRFESLYGAYRSICLLGTATKKRRSHAEALAGLLT